jgi:hypothetical protein
MQSNSQQRGMQPHFLETVILPERDIPFSRPNVFFARSLSMFVLPCPILAWMYRFAGEAICSQVSWALPPHMNRSHNPSIIGSHYYGLEGLFHFR